MKSVDGTYSSKNSVFYLKMGALLTVLSFPIVVHPARKVPSSHFLINEGGCLGVSSQTAPICHPPQQLLFSLLTYFSC